MTASNFLSVSDIEKEINTGKASIKFLLKRFSRWLPHSIENGLPKYDPQILTKLIFIQEKLDSGMIPSQIETALESDQPPFQSKGSNIQNPPEDIRMSKDSLHLIKSLFADIGIQQERIAIAHEKRAQAEERKAAAIEKRAEAEEKKARAMNNIAQALQDMNKSRNDFALHQLAREATSAIITDEISDNSLDEVFSNSKVLEYHDSDIDDSDVLDDIGGLTDLLDDHQTDPDENDNLFDLLEDEFNDNDSDKTEMDDLSLLIDEPFDHSMDDLSALIDDVSEPLDDLSLLIEDVSEPLDDLSALIEDESDPLDDLSLLIDDVTAPLDDLSKLIDDIPQKSDPAGQSSMELDDLSKLIDMPFSPDSPVPDMELDDLSLLLDDPLPGAENIKPILKPDITPEEDLPKYKAAIMSIIIQLKSDGFSVEQTTERFNNEGILTLSGKAKWGTKSIAQIYKFIDAASSS